MNRPTKHILTTSLILLAFITSASLISLGTLWGLWGVFLGATVGPVMALTYPFSASFKFAYILGLVLVAVALGVGVRFRGRLYGQVLVVLCLVGWVCLGLIGLGTGT